MPRPGPRRLVIALRLSAQGITAVDERARQEGLIKGNGEPNRSEMVRLMMAHAYAYMPKGWRPGNAPR